MELWSNKHNTLLIIVIVGGMDLLLASERQMVVIKITRWFLGGFLKYYLSPLSTDAASQLDVLGHDGDPLGVDGRQVGVLEQAHQVGLGRLL